ncbi:hypothetical protein HED49_00975 [Ochrobactrum daejeonense]|nr:hypothetical protein [Brucella daejeonensis]
MAFSVATWNINSVRLRMPLVEQFLRDYQPDVLCLQETKCPDNLFPFKGFRALGYEHIAISGQKGYHGVATVSKRPLDGVEKIGFCEMGDCRHLSAVVEAGAKSSASIISMFRRGRRAGPADQSEVRAQAGFSGRNARHCRRPARRTFIGSRWRSQYRPARKRCLVAQAIAQDRQPHAG